MAAAAAVTPETAAARFGISFLVGLLLGVWYGFLRPLRPKHTALSDLLFSAELYRAGLYVCFAVCRGDIRFAYLFGLISGCLVWEMTLGLWLRPVFRGIWDFLGRIFRFLTLPMKKICQFSKKIVCICGKMGYNKEYLLSGESAKPRRYHPCRQKTIRVPTKRS